MNEVKSETAEVIEAIKAVAQTQTMARAVNPNWVRAGVVANAAGQTALVAAAITYILS